MTAEISSWRRRPQPARRRLDLRGRIALGYLGFLTIVAIVGDRLMATGANVQDLEAVLTGPGSSHWLGTDDLGRDVLARLVEGASVAIQASSTAVIVAVVIGVPVGVIAGYVGGVLDSLLMRLVDTLLAFPSIVLAIGIIGALGPGLFNAMLAVGAVLAPQLARIARGQVIATKGRLYVEAATTFGASGTWIAVRHILPNAIQPVLVQLTIFFGIAIQAEAGLSFLGFGVEPPNASWGLMLREATRFNSYAPYHVIAPGLAIAVTVLAINALGDALRDLMDVKR